MTGGSSRASATSSCHPDAIRGSIEFRHPHGYRRGQTLVEDQMLRPISGTPFSRLGSSDEAISLSLDKLEGIAR